MDEPSNIWQPLQNFLSSSETWKALLFLVIGAILGAILGARLSTNAQRPKLIVIGNGGGGAADGSQHWNINFTNRPSFLGRIIDGESARKVNPWIVHVDSRKTTYPLVWSRPNEQFATIDPGDQKSLDLFHSFPGDEGYFILDGAGERVARFQSRENKFVIRLNDRLGRSWEYKIVVLFDDTHLRNPPQLQIISPLTMSMRLQTMKGAFRGFLSAFRRQ